MDWICLWLAMNWLCVWLIDHELAPSMIDWPWIVSVYHWIYLNGIYLSFNPLLLTAAFWRTLPLPLTAAFWRTWELTPNIMLNLRSIAHILTFMTKAVFTCVRTRHLHTSSAHAIRFRHPHGVFTCVRVLHPSNMLNIEFLFCLLSVVLYNCFYGKWLKCVKCGFYVCKSCLSLCLHNKSIHDLWIMLQWDFGVILIRCFVSFSLRWICKKVFFHFKSTIYVKYLLILLFFQW